MGGKIYSVNALYRPSSQNTNDEYETFLTASHDILTKLQGHNDVNFVNTYCKLPILPPKPSDASAPELFEGFVYKQLIDIPTCITTDTTYLIKLQFLDNLDSITGHGTLPRFADNDDIFSHSTAQLRKYQHGLR